MLYFASGLGPTLRIYPVQVSRDSTPESARKFYHPLVRLRWIDYERGRAYEQKKNKG